MKKIFILFISIVLGVSLYAQDKKIAVMQPIKKSEEIKDMVSDMVRGELTKALTKKDGYRAFSRNDLDKVVEEFRFQESGMAGENERRKMGKMVGADYVCISKISTDGKAYYIQAQLINIESGEISNNGTDLARGDMQSINIACKNVAAQLIGEEPKEAKSNERIVTKPRPVDTNPNNFLVIEVEANLKTHKIMICDKPFTDNMSFLQAKKACENLNYGGYSDWRLPTVYEGMALHKIHRSLANRTNYLSWTSTKGDNAFVYTYNSSYSNKLMPPHKKWGVLAVRDFN